MIAQMWTAERYRAPFSDAQSPTLYRLGTFQSGARHQYTTERGRARIIASYLAHAQRRGVIVSDVEARPGVRIIVYRVTALNTIDTGRYFAVVFNDQRQRETVSA